MGNNVSDTHGQSSFYLRAKFDSRLAIKRLRNGGPMNKRQEANLKVKRSITDALFGLMKRKNFADIHITEIVNEAGVARASFYRNYDSKEGVLVTLIRDVLQKFYEEITYSQGSFYCYENVRLSFQYFKEYQDYILNLYQSGFASSLLEELNQFHESIEGTMLAKSLEKYELYMYIGALFNTALVWLLEGAETNAEDMAAFFFHSMVKNKGAGES